MVVLWQSCSQPFYSVGAESTGGTPHPHADGQGVGGGVGHVDVSYHLSP